MTTQSCQVHSSKNSTSTHSKAQLTPAVTISSSEQGWDLWAELPYVDQHQVSLSTEGRTLTLEAPSKEGQYHRKLKFPNSVDWDSTNAEWKEGLLHIHIPLTQSIKKEIPIQVS